MVMAIDIKLILAEFGFSRTRFPDPRRELPSEKLVAPSPSDAGLKSRCNADERQNISLLTILSEEKDESEPWVSARRTKRNKFFLAEPPHRLQL